MEPRINFVTLGVTDVARSRRFYEGLGWKASGTSGESVAFFQLGGLVLCLFGRQALAADAGHPDRPGLPGAVTLSQNQPSKKVVDAVMAEAELAGATILKPAEDVFWGGYSGYFADPDGHPWEVAWNPHSDLLADGTVRLRA